MIQQSGGGTTVSGTFMFIMAAIQLGLGALFIVIALAEPGVLGDMIFGALIFFVVGIVLAVIGVRLRRSGQEADRIVGEGIAGQAQIVAATQTGMYLNNNPRVKMDLLVELPGRDPYRAQRSEFVPLILLGRLSSGVPLPVKVDRADPQKLIIEWSEVGIAPAALGGRSPAGPAAASTPTSSVALSASGSSASAIDESLSQVQAALQSSGVPIAAPYATPDQGSYTTEQLRAWLRENGVPATARIDQVMDMGQVVGDERLYTMQVTLELPGEAPKQLKPSAAMVPLTAVPKVRVGWRIPVRVAAENHQLMMFEWEKV